jgi:pseudouridine-5'-phosphate glycosidase
MRPAGVETQTQSGLAAAIEVSQEVTAALAEHAPVVALETAVATHGLPTPHNLDALASMKREIEQEGGTAAICLALDGKLCIGASLNLVAQACRDRDKQKASVRDLGYVLAKRIPGGLTVSGTLPAASLAGIRVLATGGIGGVHRGAEVSGDVSADLYQLARSPVITVCSGAKSVLDIPRTLEMLETLGVPVYSYRTPRFPAFYLESSGQSTAYLESTTEIARVARAHWGLGNSSGIVIGQPLPAERALSQAEWDALIDRAHGEATHAGVQGADVTPYLLAHVAEASSGATVRANLTLLQHNARLGAQIAAALSA